MTAPLPGTFIRPVGPTSFLHCLEVEWASGNRVGCSRWGMRDGLPFDDGYLSQPNICIDLVPVRPGVWRRAAPAWAAPHLGPVYYVRTCDQGAQLDLFEGLPA